ncbi:MAG: LysR family transcriptional regulator [Pseudomonadota bacterium]
MDHLTSMRVFVRVVERGGLSAAAVAEHISPTMVGKHVRYLEERLGVRLLNRTTRRQSLTEMGQVYYERCKHALAEVEAADSCVSSLREAPRGVLRVAAAVSFGVHSLTPMINAYLAANPEVRIELSLSDRVVDLIEDGIDCAIRIGKLPDSTLIARPLAPYRMVVCAAPGYLARYGTPHTPEQLKEHNCLGFLNISSQHQWSFADGEAVRSVPVRGNFCVNSGQALRMAALSGVGIALQPWLMAQEDIEAGRLVLLLADHPTPTSPLHIVYPFTRHMTPKLRTFVDCVLAHFGSAAAAAGQAPA